MTPAEIIAKVKAAGNSRVYVQARPWFYLKYGWDTCCFMVWGKEGYGERLPDADGLFPPGMLLAAGAYASSVQRLGEFTQYRAPHPVVIITVTPQEFRDLALHVHATYWAYYATFPAHHADSLLRYIREEERTDPRKAVTQ